MIKVFVVGNLVADPVMKTTKNGEAVCNFTVAANSLNRKKAKEPLYIRFAAWQGMASICGEYLLKGRRVAVTGRDLRVSVYIGKDGKPHASLDADVDDMEFMSSRRGEMEAMVDEQNQRREEALSAMEDETEGFIPVDAADEPLPF